MSTFVSWIDLLQARADGMPDRTAFVFLAEGEAETDRLTFAELDRKARAIGQGLLERGFGGERILLLYPPGLEFVAAFFGCLYAGAVAVTAYQPRHDRHIGRMRAIVMDACPAAALTAAETLSSLREAAAAIPEMSGVACLSTSGAEGDAGVWRNPGVRPEDLAFLQYTSGSTSSPKGVMVGHGNLLHNCGVMADRWGLSSASVMVSWLPTFHDLGLIYGTLSPVWGGFPAVHMPPVAFLKQPVRWLRAISRYRGTHSGGPNFGYELCVRRISPEQRADLDLSSWELALNGAEPIRLSTVQAFYETFHPHGLRWTTNRPGYGLAEGTLLVSGSAIGEEPRWLMLDDEALQKDRVVLSSGPGSRPLMGCGRPVADWDVAVVRPETLEPCGLGEVGEVWLAGPSVAQGYWRRPEETEQTFGGRLAAGEGPYLRTGDLGFLHEGELYITGRLKDLIIIRGSNHYPQDIEATAERAYPGLRPGSTAAFAVDEGDEERLVVVGELDRPEEHDVPEVIRTVRQAVAEEHELQVYGMVLASKGSVPKTSSGKIQRRGCRMALQDGTLEVVARSFEPAVSGGASPARAAEPAAAAGRSGGEVRAWLIVRVAERLRMAAGEIDTREPLTRYGLDSASAVDLAGEVEEWLERPLPSTLFYDFPTIEALARHLSGEAEAPRPAMEPSAGLPGEPVAIVGIGCRFPGAAGPEAFWSLLAAGVDAVTERASRTGTGRTGGFLDGVDLFDAAFFGISPREAVHMDPQQRLLLEASWEALEDAGCDPRSLAGTRTGVFIGISSPDYGYLQFVDPSRAEATSGPGGALSVAANRLSYFYDWHGPSLAVDTSCSSSLVAVDLACRALSSGECPLALAGGVNLVLLDGTTQAFVRAGLIAVGGRCRAFDQAADGYVRSEGAGVVVLKPLSRALADGDRVYAVIRATAVNQDGRTNGLVAPSRRAQEEVLRAAWRRAGVPPGRAQYVEAHGSGTSLGDAIEAAALGAVLAEGRAPEAPCLIGSVKTNLGHLESAAGIAGLIKVALSLSHRQVPPSLHFRQPSAKIPFTALPLQVNTELRPWPAAEGPALAGVSSFGIGGTNAHIVLEGPPPPAPAEGTRAEKDWQVLVWSARTESALEEATARLARHLAEHPEEDLADLAFTLQTGRSVFPWRRALVCRNREDAAAALAARDPQRLLTAERRGEARPLSFLFPGLADHYPHMGRELYRTEPVFRAELDRCCEILRPLLGLDPRAALFPEGGEERPAAGALRAWLRPEAATVSGPLRRTAVAQPVLFAVEYALARLLQSWGLAPQALLGFSLGEYTAACLAGVFSLEDALRVVARRAALIEELPEGGMLAVALPAAEVRERLGAELSLAVDAGPRNSVVAGPVPALDALAARLSAEGHACRRLPNAHAFHSALMRAVAEPFAALLREVRLAPPRLPWVSNVTGTWITPEQATDPEYWVTHMCETVRFADGVSELWRDPAMVLLEVGPGQGLSTLALQLAEDASGRLALPAMRHAHAASSDREHLLGTVARLWLAGVAVDWRSFHDGPRLRLRLPRYPFERQSFWLESGGAQILPFPSRATARLVFRREAGGAGEADAEQVPAEVVAALRRLLADRGLDRLVIAAEDLAELVPATGLAPVAGPLARSRYRRPELATPYVPPDDETERKVAGMLGELLGIEEIGIHDNFFELGGDSLLAVQLASRLGAAFGIELPTVLLFSNPTARMLTRLISAPDAFGLGGSAEGPPGVEPPPPLVAVPRSADLPLSISQQRVWFLEQLRPGRLLSIAGALRIQGPLQAGALIRAFDAMVRRHESLRTNFAAAAGRPVQVIHAEPTVGLAEVDLSALPPAARAPEALRAAGDDAARPFDLARDPLVRAGLFRLGSSEWVLSLTLHHIVSDLWSMTVVFFQELGVLYRTFAAGDPPGLPPLPVQCADVAVWEQSWLRGEVLAAHLRYWRERLAGVPALLPRLADTPATDAPESGRFELSLAPDLVQRLAAVGAEEGATRFMVFLAAFDVVLAHTAQVDRIAVVTNIAGRNHAQVQRLIGGFSRQIALATDLGGDPTLREVLRRVRDTILEAHAYQALSLQDLEERLAGELDLDHLSDVEFTADPPTPTSLDVAGLQVVLLPRLIDQAESGLSLQIAPAAGALRAVFGYDASRFHPSTIARFAELYRSVLSQLAESPDRPLGELLSGLAEADAGSWSSREQELAQASLGRLRRSRRRSG